MIRLKQKKDEEKKIAEEKNSQDSNLSNPTEVDSKESSEKVDEDIENPNPNDSSGVKLLGIGGKSVGQSGSKKRGKRRTPGEIRIQKGNQFFHSIFEV